MGREGGREKRVMTMQNVPVYTSGFRKHCDVLPNLAQYCCIDTSECILGFDTLGKISPYIVLVHI